MTGEAPRPQPKPVKRVKSKARLVRKAPMRKRAPRRLKGAGSDPAYLAWVRTRPCMVAPNYPTEWCWGRIHAHHAGSRPGVAMKAPDGTAIPLCERHHRFWHDAVGYFADMSKAGRALWAADAIAATQAAWSRA